MNPLSNPNPLNTSLSGAQHLSAPTGSVPGSGFLNSIANLFRAPAPGTSLTGNNPSPLLNPGLTNTTLPGLGSVVAGMPGLPSIHGGNAPASHPALGLGLGPQTAQASTNPVNVGASDPARNPVFLAPSAPAPASSPTSQAGYNVGNYTPQNFTVPTNKVYDSSYLSPGAIQDLQDARTAKQDAMTSGSADGTNLIPSDTLQGQIANQLYQSKLYSPDEQSLIANGQDLTAQINQKKLAERRKTAQLLEDGTITKEQATQFVQESERRANQELADLSVQQDSNTARLSTLGLLRQNQVGALTSVADMLKGSEVSPGSTLFNPITGVQYQGQGASPQTIVQTAQTLATLAQQTGTLQTNPDGSINMTPYLQQAQQIYGGGAQGSNTNSGTTTGGPLSSGQPNPSSPGTQAYQYGVSAGLSPSIAGGVVQSPVTGDYYISGSRVPAGQEVTATSQGGRANIAYVPAENVGNIQQLDIAIGQMQSLYGLAQQYLSPGLLGRLKGLTTNQAQALLQTDPGWAKFNSVRLQAIDYLKGLAQGGGFRTTEAEINTAANSIFSLSDNLGSANAKMETAMKNINLAYKEYLPTHSNTPLVMSSPSNTTIGGTTYKLVNGKWTYQ